MKKAEMISRRIEHVPVATIQYNSLKKCGVDQILLCRALGGRTKTYKYIYKHSRNFRAYSLVWGSLRLAPIRVRSIQYLQIGQYWDDESSCFP